MAYDVKDAGASTIKKESDVVNTDEHRDGVAVKDSVLPTGAATEATLSTLAAAIDDELRASPLTISDADTVPLANLVSGHVANTDGASTAVIAAQGEGVVTYLTDIAITNSSAAAVVVELKDGATVKWGQLIPAGGGIVKTLASPLVGTANTAWNVDAASATTTIYCSLGGFKV